MDQENIEVMNTEQLLVKRYKDFLFLTHWLLSCNQQQQIKGPQGETWPQGDSTKAALIHLPAAGWRREGAGGGCGCYGVGVWLLKGWKMTSPPWVSGHTLQEPNEGAQTQAQSNRVTGQRHWETTEPSNLVTASACVCVCQLVCVCVRTHAHTRCRHVVCRLNFL